MKTPKTSAFGIGLLGIVLTVFSGNPALAADPMATNGIFDELRFGAAVSINGSHSHESGIFPSATVFFDPLGSGETTKTIADILLEPRIYLGASVATGDGASQVYTGLSWTAPVTDRFFVEAGFGGTVHDGDLDDDGSDGPKLGCRLLFREYVAAGYRITDHWQVLATVDHSSHANLCDGPNGGLSHAGVSLGYKF